MRVAQGLPNKSETQPEKKNQTAKKIVSHFYYIP